MALGKRGTSHQCRDFWSVEKETLYIYFTSQCSCDLLLLVHGCWDAISYVSVRSLREHGCRSFNHEIILNCNSVYSGLCFDFLFTKLVLIFFLFYGQKRVFVDMVIFTCTVLYRTLCVVIFHRSQVSFRKVFFSTKEKGEDKRMSF